MPKERCLSVDIWQRHRVLDLHASIREDMTQLSATVTEHFADQQSAMALLWSSATA
jgi:hypothetical protein